MKRALLVFAALAALEPLYRAYFLARRALLAPDDSAFQVFAVGESTMTGYPYHAKFSLPDLILAQFDGRLGGKPVRLTSLAQAGESIYPQAVALERALRGRTSRAPGLVLIYSGNNDAGQPAPLSRFEAAREWLLARSSLLSDLWYFGERRGFFPRTRNLGTYEYYLRRVLRESRRAGLTPVLSTVVSNVSGMDPGASPACELLRSDVDAALREGEAAEARRDWRAAIAGYERARAPGRLAPYLDFRIGRCREALGDYERARESFRRAVDAPSCNLFLRATSLQNGFIRTLAREEGVPLVDAERAFEERSEHGLLSGALFSDGQHPNLEGYAVLAHAYADEISRALGEPVARPLTSAADLKSRVGFGPKDQAAADLISGSWLLTVSITHFRPAERLRTARDYFERAARASPESFTAWLGLGLAQAALHGFLEKQENLDFLAKHHLYYGELGHKVRRDAVPEIAAKLKAAGVPRETLDRMLATARVDPELL